MAFVLGDRVKETTTTTGTGTITLAGAATGFQSFSSGVGAGNDTFYAIVSQGGSQWEVGVGTLATTTTLTRTAANVISGSSGAGTLVSFSAGTKDVFCTLPAARTGLGIKGMLIHAQVIDTDEVIPTGFNAVSGGAVEISSTGSVEIPTGSTWTIV